MTTETLTADLIKDAAPGEIRDTKVPGLLVRVRATGRRTFEVVLKARGVRKAQTLGAWPHLTVNAAREQARIWLNAEGAKLPPRRTDRLIGSSTLREFALDQYFSVANLAGEGEARRVLGLGRDDLNDKGRKADNLTWEALLDKPMRDIRRKDIEDILARWIKAGAAPATVNRKATVLRAVLSKACERHELSEHPMTGIRPQRVDDDARMRTFSDEERSRIYAVIDAKNTKPEVATAIYIMLNTGVRPGREVERLRIDPKNASVVVPTTSTSKAAKVRHIPINPTLAARLKQHKSWRAPTRKEFDAVMARAEVEDAFPYACRHDFLSRLANGGVPMHVVQKIAGHSSIVVTSKYYTHLETDALRAAVERV